MNEFEWILIAFQHLLETKARCQVTRSICNSSKIAQSAQSFYQNSRMLETLSKVCWIFLGKSVVIGQFIIGSILISLECSVSALKSLMREHRISKARFPCLQDFLNFEPLDFLVGVLTRFRYY